MRCSVSAEANATERWLQVFSCGSDSGHVLVGGKTWRISTSHYNLLELCSVKNGICDEVLEMTGLLTNDQH